MASRTFEFKLIGIFFYFCPKIFQKKFQLDRPQIENFKASEHSREGCALPTELAGREANRLNFLIFQIYLN